MTIDLSDERLTELEALAEKATPGPWRVEQGMGVRRDCDRLVMVADCDDCDFAREYENAAYIAALSPDVALALIAELRAARRRADTDRWMLWDAYVAEVRRFQEMVRDLTSPEIARLSWERDDCWALLSSEDKEHLTRRWLRRQGRAQ
jgi:hypothetical protein